MLHQDCPCVPEHVPEKWLDHGCELFASAFSIPYQRRPFFLCLMRDGCWCQVGNLQRNPINSATCPGWLMSRSVLSTLFCLCQCVSAAWWRITDIFCLHLWLGHPFTTSAATGWPTETRTLSNFSSSLEVAGPLSDLIPVRIAGGRLHVRMSTRCKRLTKTSYSSGGWVELSASD